MDNKKFDAKQYQRCNQVRYNDLPAMVFPNQTDTDGRIDITIFTESGTECKRVEKTDLTPIALTCEVIDICRPKYDRKVTGGGYLFEYGNEERKIEVIVWSNGVCEFRTADEEKDIINDIEYLHELQNLIKEYTGQTLHMDIN